VEIEWRLKARINYFYFKKTAGNLTVLTDELNPSVSNSGWEEKRQAVEEHTVLRLNQELVDNGGTNGTKTQ
jgi:hypothetical protein